MRQAEAAAANRGNWLREMRDLPGAEEVELAGMDVVAMNAIVTRLTGQLKPNRVTDDLRTMRENLDQDDAATYENGRTLLGTFLGAQSYKPKGDGRFDAAWVWDISFWMTVEAKSEQDEDDVVALR